MSACEISVFIWARRAESGGCCSLEGSEFLFTSSDSPALLSFSIKVFRFEDLSFDFLRKENPSNEIFLIKLSWRFLRVKATILQTEFRGDWTLRGKGQGCPCQSWHNDSPISQSTIDWFYLLKLAKFFFKITDRVTCLQMTKPIYLQWSILLITIAFCTTGWDKEQCSLIYSRLEITG